MALCDIFLIIYILFSMGYMAGYSIINNIPKGLRFLIIIVGPIIAPAMLGATLSVVLFNKCNNIIKNL